MNDKQLSPSDICATLNAAKWRGREDWIPMTHNGIVFSRNQALGATTIVIADAAAIAELLLLKAAPPEVPTGEHWKAVVQAAYEMDKRDGTDACRLIAAITGDYNRMRDRVAELEAAPSSASSNADVAQEIADKPAVQGRPISRSKKHIES